MDRNKTSDNRDQVNLIKIISNHINYLENDILVYENILDDLDNNKLTENFIENLKDKEENDSNLIQNIEHSYFYYLKNQKEEIDKINFIIGHENEKVKKQLFESQKKLEDYKYQINLANNEINEVTKQKKILEEKVFLFFIINNLLYLIFIYFSSIFFHFISFYLVKKIFLIKKIGLLIFNFYFHLVC